MYEWFLSYLRGCANATAFQPQLLAAATHWSRYEHFVQKLVDFQRKIHSHHKFLLKNEQKWSNIFSQVTYNLAPVKGRMTRKTASTLKPRKIDHD